MNQILHCCPVYSTKCPKVLDLKINAVTTLTVPPDRLNFIYYKVTLYVSGIKAHIIRSHQTVTAASVTYHFTGKTTSLQIPDQTPLEGSSCTDMTEPENASHVAVQTDTLLYSHILLYIQSYIAVRSGSYYCKFSHSLL